MLCYTAVLIDRRQPYTANFRLNPCRQRSVLYIEDAEGGFLSYTKDLYRPPAQYPYPYVRKGGSTVLTVRVRYIIKAPLVLMGLSN